MVWKILDIHKRLLRRKADHLLSMDEVAVVDESDAENTLRAVNACMEKPPAWAVGLPLAAEVDWAKSYGEAK